MEKQYKRMSNILYRLRKKGIRCVTRERMIFFHYDKDPMAVIQIRRLCREYNFNVQFEII